MFSDFLLFLDILVDRGHKQHEAAWREFDNRYSQKILRKLNSMLQDEKLARECYARVFERLLDHDFKAIRDFRERGSEGAFVVYLIRISWNIALNELKRQIGLDIEEINPEIDEKPENNIERKVHRWLVLVLRSILSITKKEAHTTERDIFMFSLRTVYGFHSKEIASVPILDVTDHAVDIVKSRITKKLKNQKKP